MEDPHQLVEQLKSLQNEIHDTALSKGWWVEHENLVSVLKNHGDEYGLSPSFGDMLYKMARTMLMVTELSEGVEFLRKGDAPDDKLPQFNGLTVELADCIIRALDLAGRFDLPVAEAVVAKVAYNRM